MSASTPSPRKRERLVLRGLKLALHYTAPVFFLVIVVAIAAPGLRGTPSAPETHGITVATFLVLALLSAVLQWYVLGFQRIATRRTPGENRVIVAFLARRSRWHEQPSRRDDELEYRAFGLRKNTLVTIRFDGSDVLVNAINQAGISTLGRGSLELKQLRAALA